MHFTHTEAEQEVQLPQRALSAVNHILPESRLLACCMGIIRCINTHVRLQYLGYLTLLTCLPKITIEFVKNMYIVQNMYTILYTSFSGHNVEYSTDLHLPFITATVENRSTSALVCAVIHCEYCHANTLQHTMNSGCSKADAYPA